MKNFAIATFYRILIILDILLIPVKFVFSAGIMICVMIALNDFRPGAYMKLICVWIGIMVRCWLKAFFTFPLTEKVTDDAYSDYLTLAVEALAEL